MRDFDLNASNRPLQRSALTAKPSMTVRISSSSIAFVLKWLDGSGICVGAHMICGGCSSDYGRPWVSWLIISRRGHGRHP